MNEVEGIVISVDDGFAVVETGPRAAGCGRCHEPGGCGGGLLNLQDSDASARRYRVGNGIQAHAGDRVSLCVEQGAVLTAAMLSYGLPLLLIILGAALGTWRFGSDAAAVAGGLIGLGIGLILLRAVAKRREPILALRIKMPDHCFDRKSTT